MKNNAKERQQRKKSAMVRRAAKEEKENYYKKVLRLQVARALNKKEREICIKKFTSDKRRIDKTIAKITAEYTKRYDEHIKTRPMCEV